MIFSIPLLTFSFLDYFLSRSDFHGKTLLEIGSGDSTLFWEKHFNKVISYEDNFVFYQELKNKVNKEKTEINFFDRNIFYNDSFFENVRGADYIIIDNDPNTIDRLDFCKYVHSYKKKDCQIILDNGTWNVSAYNFLMERYFCKDFPGINKDNQLTVTTIFDSERESSYYS